MNIQRYSDPKQFLMDARPLLEPEEAANNLLIGLAGRLARQTDPDMEVNLLYLIFEAEAPVLAMLRNPGHYLVVYGLPESWATALPLAVRTIQAVCQDLPGVHGQRAQGLDFARAWGKPFAERFGQGIYALREVLPPRPAAGAARLVTQADLPLMEAWLAEFIREAMQETPDPASVRKQCLKFVAEQTMWFWEDGGPVCMTACHRPTWHGTCISYVYTPQAHRGHGYGSCLTAAVSQHALDQGKDFVMLFTDLANPTSNKIYQRLGYELVAEFAMIGFSDQEEAGS